MFKQLYDTHFVCFRQKIPQHHTSMNCALMLKSGGGWPTFSASLRRSLMPQNKCLTARGMMPCTSLPTAMSKPVPIVYVLPEPVYKCNSMCTSTNISSSSNIGAILNFT